jgi:hypothetical protein
MHAQLVCLAAALLGVDVGWQPWPDGGVEYLIQIPPHAVKTLESGQPIASDVPPNVAVRAFRITIGSETLPHKLPPAAEETPHASAPPPKKTFSDPLLPPASTPTIDTEVARPPVSTPPESPFSVPHLTTPAAIPQPVPRALAPDPSSKPLGERQTAFVQPVAPKAKTEVKPTAPASQPTEAPAEASKPWMPLTLVLLGLFTSLGGNLYLGWITWDTRSRYRELVAGGGG